MNRVLTGLLAVMLLAVMLLAGCGDQDPKTPYTEPAETEQQLHTMVPTDTAEPEWVAVEYCTLRVLNTAGEELLAEEDIEAFAIAPFNGSDTLVFRLTYEGIAMLEAAPDPAGYVLTVNGDRIATLHLSDDGTELYADSLSEEQMWKAANKIRGFE